ncbi:hypothetical protein MJ575_00185 [Klebsiella pneumoniae]|nr:hypothetical protein MJ575_29710 [Klebsiella pneumoniae]UMX79830.1 hypothetical protein MJ575_30800 [Klebsiella pneumoniae]UMX79872.1 hypothetical protein MJ575_00185 [Klebsiella pneumoniae]
MTILTESGLKITPLDAAVPDRAQALIDQTSQLPPRIKITELLMMDTDGVSRYHQTANVERTGRCMLTQPRDAINPADQDGRVEPWPDLRQAVLAASPHIRDETHSAALAELVNHQHVDALPPTGATARPHPPITASASARVAGGESTGHVNPKYCSELDGCSIPISPTSTRRSAPAQNVVWSADSTGRRRPAVPRVRPADRGALHRHGRLHRSRLCP